ncbi:ADP-ribosylglycohydrolase family protein [Streptomyces sp. NPDC001508]|uniref:ADP-ribosylglycohydrolase family protein n=1 Tax=Streptomyces sp. NPDC001508 TaxID=3154656 RepID=UPI003328D29C
MTEHQTTDRVRGALVGLAIGDAAGWPAGWHRSHRLVEWTRRARNNLDRFAEDHRLTTLPVPFALNQPVVPLRLGPGDDAEWAAFTALALLVHGRRDPDADRAAITSAWLDLAARTGEESIWARISVRTALDNLNRGLRPPASGHDNPHHFDDAAAVRAVAIGARYAGDPAAATAVAATDAAVTQSGDGVHAARAVAAAIAVACDPAGDLPAVTAAALAELPAVSAVGREVRAALALAAEARGAFALAPALSDEVTDPVYSYGVAASDTLAVAFAMAVAADGRLTEAVPAAACLARTADSAPALAGALCGALNGFTALPAAWTAVGRRLEGCCLPDTAGVDLVDLADRLSAAPSATASPVVASAAQRG